MYFSSLALLMLTTLLLITLYLFQQTDFLNPLINSFDNFTLSSADKVTIETFSFASVLLKVALPAPVEHQHQLELQ